MNVTAVSAWDTSCAAAGVFSSIRMPWASVVPILVGEWVTASLNSTSPAFASLTAVRPPGSANRMVNGSSTYSTCAGCECVSSVSPFRSRKSSTRTRSFSTRTR